MSSVAGNKMRLVQRLGRDTMPGWIAGEDSAPIMEEQPIPEPFLILPLGGTREIGSHKGYGLAVMVEVLTSLLAGGAGGPDRRARQAHHLLAYHVDAFTDLETSTCGACVKRYVGGEESLLPERASQRTSMTTRPPSSTST